MRFTTFQNGAETCARNCAIALGLTIPISVALDNLLLGVVLVSWLAAGRYRQRVAAAFRNRMAVASAALFGLLAIGISFSHAPAADAVKALGKYADLAFVPIFVSLFHDERARRRARLALAFSLLLTLVLSCLAWMGVFGDSVLMVGDRGNPVVFKQYLTHSLLMSFAALLFLQLALSARSSLGKAGWGAAAALAAVNVILMVQGRTGQLILVALALYWAYSVWRWRGALAAVAVAAILAAALALGLTAAGDRVMQAFAEWSAWKPGQATQTSVGMRLEFYRNSLELVREHPVIGTGTGSFSKVYAARVAGTPMAPSDNPHNEYLNVAVQLGLVGVAALLYLFYCGFRYAPMLPTSAEQHLARGLMIAFVLGSLMNSLLLDHTEGLFFAWLTGLLYAGLKPPRSALAAAA